VYRHARLSLHIGERTLDMRGKGTRQRTTHCKYLLFGDQQATVGLSPQKLRDTAPMRDQEQIAQLQAQVADLKSEMADLKESRALVHPPSKPPFASPEPPFVSHPKSLPSPGPTQRATVLGPSAIDMSPESKNLSPKYAQSLTLEDRGILRPAPASSSSSRSAPTTASLLGSPSKSPGGSVYTFADREYVGREYRGGPRLPAASGRLTLEVLPFDSLMHAIVDLPCLCTDILLAGPLRVACVRGFVK
jgi:hypothetical protein